MDNLDVQISQAIAFALNPSPSTPQATRDESYVFLQRVRDASSETWQACLSLFLALKEDGTGYKWGAEERMFGIQVVGDR